MSEKEGLEPPPIHRPKQPPTDDAAVASEPMDLQRLPEARPVPPGRQRTGDPPAPRRSKR